MERNYALTGLKIRGIKLSQTHLHLSTMLHFSDVKLTNGTRLLETNRAFRNIRRELIY